MELKERLKALIGLGEYIKTKDDKLQTVIDKAHFNNQWFSIENIELALDAVANQFLSKEKLEKWVSDYKVPEFTKNPKKVGLVLAGNIPLVGFHDVLCVFVSGHYTHFKLSSKDEILLPFLIEYMVEKNGNIASYFEQVEQLKNIDAVIATGSNNSAKHFEHYFSKYPHIIRRNRNGIAVFNGDETKEEMIRFGKDIFTFFGLGCRNVSKIYIPESFDIKILIEVMHDHYKQLVLHHKYKNNYDYNYAIYLMNKDNFLMSGSLIWRQHPDIMSRIACIHYEKYTDREALGVQLNQLEGQIQCVVAKEDIGKYKAIDFGYAQQPSLTDYADGVDTLSFLMTI